MILERVRELIKEIMDNGGKPDCIVVGKKWKGWVGIRILDLPVVLDDSLGKDEWYVMPKAREK